LPVCRLLISFINEFSVTIWVIQRLALLLKIDLGIFVIIADGFISTIGPPTGGSDADIVAGTVNVLGCQSLRKKPIEFARGGSTGGSNTVVSPGPGLGLGFGSDPLFLQEKKVLTANTTTQKLIIVFITRFNYSLNQFS